MTALRGALHELDYFVPLRGLRADDPAPRIAIRDNLYRYFDEISIV
jgi:hypothetical protein